MLDVDGTGTLRPAKGYLEKELKRILGGLKNSRTSTVVVTGAQLPWSELRTDARQNVMLSLAVAGSFEIPEVCIVFHNRLLRANRSVKNSSSSLMEAFSSPNIAPLGIFGLEPKIEWGLILDPLRVIDVEDIARKEKDGQARREDDREKDACNRPPGIPTTASLAPRDPTEKASADPPAVSGACTCTLVRPQAIITIKMVPGISCGLLLNMLSGRTKLRALILEVYGSGTAPSNESFKRSVVSLCESDVIVVICTQCVSGSAEGSTYEAGKWMQEVGVVYALDMTSAAAYTKVIYLFSLGLSVEDIKRWMRRDLRGEMNDNAAISKKTTRRSSVTKSGKLSPSTAKKKRAIVRANRGEA
eukprot:g5474.t1